MSSRFRRLRVALALTSCLLMLLAVPVLSHTSASISPSSQTKASGALAVWQVTWNQSAATQVVFCYGDGTACPVKNTNFNSEAFSHRFYTCVYNTYTQTAYVTQGGHTLTRYASTHVTAGMIC